MKDENTKIEVDVASLANLARIELEPGEEKILAEDIAAILNYVEKVQSVATDNLESYDQQEGKLLNVFREDGDPHESGEFSEELLSAAPEREGDYFKVKKIL